MISVSELRRALKKFFSRRKPHRKKPKNGKKLKTNPPAPKGNYSHKPLARRDIKKALKRAAPSAELISPKRAPRADLDVPCAADIALEAAAFYIKVHQLREAERIVEEALISTPNHLSLLKSHAEIAMLRQAWSNAETRWKQLFTIAEAHEKPVELQIDALCGQLACARVAGQVGDFLDVIKAHFGRFLSTWKNHLPHGYATFTVFHRKATRIDYHIKIFDVTTNEIKHPTVLVITFDSRHIAWDKDPFAIKALRQRDIDILAVRKRRSGDTHQDLDRRDFIDISAGIKSAYKDCVAIGSSLGAYCALYYAAHLPNCRILAMAPRNSLNPKYGLPRYIRPQKYTHEYDMPRLADCRPTILYDPKEIRDHAYIGFSIRSSFPNAHVLHYPYCGHTLPHYLLDVGTLKNAVLGFCAGAEFPPFDRNQRRGSAAYWRNLAKLNLMAGRTNWARNLAQHAVRLGGGQVEESRKLLKKIATWNKEARPAESRLPKPIKKTPKRRKR